ncbi:MAG: hypothetical protein KDA16_10840 [Phycisphaerales bacterium]|nr:hypothetical protein [Phycisphaerales bacterium]
MSQAIGADNDGREERLRKLEEALAFSEHRGDQLSGEVERAFAEIKRLNERFDRIERRMSMLGDDDGQTE